MLRSITLTVGLLAAITGASAADMPMKAPKPTNPFISYAGSGVFWFGGAFGGATTVDTAAGGVNGRLNASGAGVSAGAGWMWGRTTTWIAADLRVNYATTSVDALCGPATVCSFKQNTSIEARVKYGGDSSRLASFLPDLGISDLFSILPAVGALTPSHPYVFGYGEIGRRQVDIAALDQRKWRGELGGGVGMVHQVGTNRAVDVWTKCGFDNATTSTGAVSLRLGTTCKGGIDLIF